MDPNANIEEQVRLAKMIQQAEFSFNKDFIESADRLAELVLALDEWLSKGGFKPERWTPVPENKETT